MGWNGGIPPGSTEKSRDPEIAPGRKRHILRLIALACFAAGFLYYLQLAFPMKEFIWDVIWLVYIGAIEWIADPLWKKVKFWKRLLLALGAAAALLALVLWLAGATKQYGIDPSYAVLVPWFVLGFSFLAWSLLIRTEASPG